MGRTLSSCPPTTRTTQMATADAALADVAAAADIEAADDDHVDVAPSADVVAAAEAHVDVVAPTPPRRPSQRAHQWLPQPCHSIPPPPLPPPSPMMPRPPPPSPSNLIHYFACGSFIKMSVIHHCYCFCPFLFKWMNGNGKSTGTIIGSHAGMGIIHHYLCLLFE